MRVIDGIHDTLRIIDTKGKNMVARKLDLSSSRLRHSISTEGMSTCGKQPTNSYATDFERGR